jgi:hypothetical protein
MKTLYFRIQFLLQKENMPYFGYKDQMVYASSSCSLFWESYRTHKISLWSNAEFLNDKADGAYSYHFALKV